MRLAQMKVEARCWTIAALRARATMKWRNKRNNEECAQKCFAWVSSVVVGKLSLFRSTAEIRLNSRVTPLSRA